ncbi:MAG: GMC family oxidoreductase N-terminal domain-containing protein [Gemmatimonas sp.]|jgi:choline dehydrogenase-like flavoprotein|uniref:GMC family oxidoreductase N-terminal domain-containing protein n=1 Tax=Gemmatimonas sp. TaxID=1962908 RepID=UPI00391EF30E|nr:GMC family oxidoreductase [Gemmatimonadota bacterium]
MATLAAPSTRRPQDAAPAPHLSAPQRDTLAALAACLIEGAPPADETISELVARCDRRLTALPLHRRAAFGQALDALGSRVAVLLAVGRARPFADLAPADQLRCLTAWGESALGPIRAAYQSVRRLVLSVHYARPDVAAAIGYAGPLHRRAPQVPWEGPLPPVDVRAQGEPVVRGRVVLPGVIERDPLPPGVVPAGTITGDTHRTADVVVIGTGAGGAVTAARLAEAGLQVVMLESGRWHDRADFTEEEAELTERLYADGALRTTDDAAVALVQEHTVGGSTTVNWMIMLRTPDYVLEQWARESGVAGMSPAEMAPVFDRIEQEVRAGLVPEDAHSANNRLVLDGARALGWRVHSGMINAQGCIRCGYCGVGCRHNAKQSTLLTFVPRALAAGATLFTEVAAERIEVRERDRGPSQQGTPSRKRVYATVRGHRGHPHRLTVDAPIVVAAGGAVGTPVLLERSGLGGGGVGSWLRLHPTTGVFGVYDRDIVTSAGIPLTTMCDEFIRWQGTDYGFWIETPPMLPSFMAAAMPGAGRAHAARMAQYNRLGVIVGLTRDGAARQVSSGRVSVTRHGDTSITYRLTAEDQRRVRASLSAMARLHFANGATEVGTMHTTPRVIRHVRDVDTLQAVAIGPNRMALVSAHVNGTCRMGTDPATSGATPDGERHGVRGLYITDGSLLPTALGVNPQETIMAVASVLADRMASRHAGVAAH